MSTESQDYAEAIATADEAYLHRANVIFLAEQSGADPKTVQALYEQATRTVEQTCNKNLSPDVSIGRQQREDQGDLVTR